MADDRPGLLATISAAFMMCGFDVMSGEAYTRRPRGGRPEAVDVFWLRDAAQPLGTVVRFLDASDGTLATLEVETGDRSGLLFTLSHALYEQGVQIVESEVKTLGERVFDRLSVVELDGSPISPARRLEIQVAVLSAVEPQARVVRRAPRQAETAQAVKPGRSS